MIIKSLKLENIRSYINQAIEFPSGSVLLSGDIGSGKSTILSAIEFALFGIKRKDLSGNSLLRHGKKQGSVELNFSIDDKNIIIKRNLKAGKDDVKQDSGYIITNDTKKEGTAVELKTQILELLGFPMDLVSKTKDLVYRYTVYTPQEQMKQILSTDVESRLDTLRRVFGIEKYKRIKANCFIISRHLKEKIKLFEGKTEDLDEKQAIKKQRKEEINIINQKTEDLLPEINEIKQKLEQKKSEILSIEKNIQELNQLKKGIEIGNANNVHNQNNLKKNKEEIQKIENEINILKQELDGKEDLDTEFLKKDILNRQEKISLIEKQITDLSKAIGLLEGKKQNSEALKKKIDDIDQCPTCLQKVCDDHKMMIHSNEDETLTNINEQIKENFAKKTQLEEELNLIKQGLEKIREKESELSLIKLKSIHLGEKTKLFQRLKKDNEVIESIITGNANKMNELNIKIESLKENEQKYNLVKKEYDNLIVNDKNIEIKKAELIREKQTISGILSVLEEEINKKLEIKEQLKSLKEKSSWLDNHFTNLVTTIEKHVMLAIHQEFNELFKEWFNLLIEEEGLNARLDDSFTPVVEQDGYDTEFNNLSGGERTSLALAYRLSLNKVINDLITNIKMRDLLILDEPTDGFSTEQLDRVRSVLNQLNLKQIIIVSHESKVEGFVDNIIRVEKQDQISRILV